MGTQGSHGNGSPDKHRLGSYKSKVLLREKLGVWGRTGAQWAEPWDVRIQNLGTDNSNSQQQKDRTVSGTDVATGGQRSGNGEITIAHDPVVEGCAAQGAFTLNFDDVLRTVLAHGAVSTGQTGLLGFGFVGQGNFVHRYQGRHSEVRSGQGRRQTSSFSSRRVIYTPPLAAALPALDPAVTGRGTPPLEDRHKRSHPYGTLSLLGI